MKKTGVIILLFLSATGSLFADIPLPPDQQLQQDTRWKYAQCKDAKNLLTCSGSFNDDKNSGCNRFQNNPKVYKWLARKGNSFFQEKYCQKIGLDK